MSGRWRHPNRARGKVYNKRPRRYKPNNLIVKRIEQNLEEYRRAVRYLVELVARIEV